MELRHFTQLNLKTSNTFEHIKQSLFMIIILKENHITITFEKVLIGTTF